MFTFQAPPYFFISDVDTVNAHVSQFTPIYCSRYFATRYESHTQPLHYTSRVLLEAGDIVLHLVEEQGRVVAAQAAQVWGTLYYDDGSPIGAVLVPPHQVELGDYYLFTKVDAAGKEKVYYCNKNTLTQKQIYRNVEFLSRSQPTAQMWLPEKEVIVDRPMMSNMLPYPDHVSEQFFHSAVVHYAKQGNPVSLFAAALWLRAQGKAQQAIHGLQKAAEKHFSFAWLELGFEYNDNGMLGHHPDKAVACFRQAAYGGLPLANYHLALAHIDGNGVEQSDALALTHLHKAKDGDIWAAYLALALYYRSGSFNHLRPPSSPYRSHSPAQLNAPLAAKLLFHIADKPWIGAPIATYYLAECYRTGAGVQMDKDYAKTLYKQAAELGDIRTEEIQYAAYYNGEVERLTQIAEDNPLVSYLLGRMYWFGEFAPKNFEIAKRYLKVAANSGHRCAREASQLLQNAREYWKT